MRNKTAFVITLCMLACAYHGAAQAAASAGLYAQTSEMADIMLQYDADRESILRFYGTGGSEENWWARQGDDYNSPERRQRRLQLIDRLPATTETIAI